MSLFSTLNVGASGLSVASTGLGVTGDNIANVNTTGFKQARASFADFMPNDVFGLAGSTQLGTGAATNRVVNLFGQGAISASGNSLDMAISGQGFFVVQQGDQNYFTRAGEFFLDNQGFVVTADGLNLQGHNAADGVLSTAVENLQVSNWQSAASATDAIVIDAQLSAETEVGTDLAGLDFFGTGTGTSTLEDAADAADFSTSVTVYDSLGVGHEVMVLFERSGASDWSWRAVVDATETFDGTGTAYGTADGEAFELAAGTMTFGTDGAMTAFTQTDTAGWTFEGAAAQAMTFDFGLDTAGTATEGQLVMAGNESALSSISQDGFSTGFLSSLQVRDDGTVEGNYSNGETMVLGQVVLASFQAQQGLARAGGNYYTQTAESGEAAIDAAGVGGRGAISGNALESSNVDLEEEFVTMITMQRSYQANAKTITAVDESLQVLINLV
jgi:flagellar hook protein FlgE